MFSIPANELATGKVVQETMKKVQEQTGAVVESSTQSSTGLKQFLVKGSDQRKVTQARQIIERGLSKPVTLEVEIPITTIGTIIGPKGATLKSITDETGTKIDIPRRDTLPEWDARAARAEAEASGDYDSDDEIEEPQVTITISGTGAAAKDARERVLGLISHKVSQGTTSIKNIPSKYYPFISGPRGANARKLEEEIGHGEAKIHVPPPAVWKSLQDDEDDIAVPAGKERDLSIKIKGSKDAITAVKAEIIRQFEDLVGSLKEFGIVVPKRQHRFLTGDAADDILEQTRCIIDLPPASDPNEQVMIRGPQPGLLKAIELAMSKAEAVGVETVDVVALARVHTSDASAHAKKVARYLQRSGQLKAIGNKHKGVNVYAPSAAAVESTGKVVIDVVGEDKNEVVKARDEVLAAVKAVPPTAITTVTIDPAVHSFLIGKKGAKIAQFEQANRVTAVFPQADDDSSDVHIVYNAGDVPLDKKARDAKLKEVLGAATGALQDLAKNAADVKSEVLEVEKKWHAALNRATVNALVGEDEAVTVRVGGKKDNEENTVVVRGPSTEVDRVVASIKQIVEDAKNDHIINGYTVEFDVDRKHLGHIVGSGGSSIKKLRDALGVKVDFSDEAEGAKGKKSLSKCTIVGRKEAVEEAKRRVLAQVEKLEDETTEVVKIKKELQPALIGSGGKYAIRLEEKYGVYLSFPREGKDQKPDEVIIRGGKKGVAAAKSELLEAAAYEAETRQEAKFTIPSKTIAQLVGKSGATIKGIKDETGAEIDIDREGGDKDKTTVTVRGDKKAITAAKAAVLELVERIAEEVNVSVTIEQQYHSSIIGQGGRKLRDLIAAAGGPKEANEQTGLVQFPRRGDDKTDQVRLRGRDSKLIKKIQELLEKEVEQLKNTVTVGVVVPASQHAPKIGRGGSALQDLQRRSGAEIHFPGSRRYDAVGEVSNASELGDADAGDIVKVVGSKEAVAKAAEELSVAAPERAPRRGNNGNGNLPTRTVSIPTKYYHAIADQQDLLRQFRGIGAYLTLPSAPAKPKHVRSDDIAAKTARIDLDADDTEEGEWEVRTNYEDAPEGSLDWVVKAKEEDLDAAQAILDKAVSSAAAATHVGLLTGLPRSAFPRIIGSKGATITRLRAETGADIHVGKEDDLITITGSEQSVNQAREAILSIVSRQGNRF